MNDAKYLGLDVHQATISVAVLDSAGKLVMEAILETKAETILQFLHGPRGSLQVQGARSRTDFKTSLWSRQASAQLRSFAAFDLHIKSQALIDTGQFRRVRVCCGETST